MNSIKNLAVILLALPLLFGCSNSSDSSGPPDPSLTYEIVSKKPSDYKGKRVKWIGQSGNASLKKKGSGSKVEDAVFVDPSTDFNVEIRAFTASGETDLDIFSFVGKTFWVTGTVSGTKKINMTVGGNSQRELVVPILRNAIFEPSEK